MSEPIITQVSVCNLALVKVGADRIDSITQATKSARLLNAVYANIRDEVLRAHPWNFATRRVVLGASASTPLFGYDYAFDLPKDCLKVLHLEDDSGDVDDTDFRVEAGQILCNDSSINLVYIYRNVDEGSWDASFAQAFSWRLAQEVCYALMQSSDREAVIAQRYSESLRMARSYNGAEGKLQGIVADQWTKSRLGRRFT